MVSFIRSCCAGPTRSTTAWVSPARVFGGAIHGGSPAVSGGVFGLIDGLAIMLTEPDERLWKETRMRIPTVVLDAEIDAPHVDRILVDNAAGTHDATRHLLETVKADKLFFVGGPKENFDTKRRAEKLSDAACMGRERRTGRGCVRAVFHGMGRVVGERPRERGRRVGIEGRGRACRQRRDCMGILQAVHDAGLSVPRDVRIVGFDDTRMASMVRPRLSTVRVPLVEVGEKAVQLLPRADRRSEACGGGVVHLPTRLIVHRAAGVGPEKRTFAAFKKAQHTGNTQARKRPSLGLRARKGVRRPVPTKVSCSGCGSCPTFTSSDTAGDTPRPSRTFARLDLRRDGATELGASLSIFLAASACVI